MTHYYTNQFHNTFINDIPLPIDNVLVLICVLFIPSHSLIRRRPGSVRFNQWQCFDDSSTTIAPATTAAATKYTKQNATLAKQYSHTRMLASWRHRRFGRSSHLRGKSAIRLFAA